MRLGGGRVGTRGVTRRGLLAGAAVFSGVALTAGVVRRVPNRWVSGARHWIAENVPWMGLPPDFEVRLLSQVGDLMDDGLRVPNAIDGMGCLSLPDGRWALMRNHEFEPGDPKAGEEAAPYLALSRSRPELFYDAGGAEGPGLGAVTTVIYDPIADRVDAQWASLLGTYRNCSGGVTPWGTWISCEESTRSIAHGAQRPHGFAFEVSPLSRAPVAPEPLVALGRMRREAVVVDPLTQIVYQTEDQPDGLLYRLLPDRHGRLGSGRLQALALVDRERADLRRRKSADFVPLELRLPVRWVDVDRETDRADGLRAHGADERGAALFARSEGLVQRGRQLYLATTRGGEENGGGVWRYSMSPAEGRPEEERSPGEIELIVDADRVPGLQNPDHLALAPWGDVLACEDQGYWNRVVGITPSGDLYPLLTNVANGAEFSGLCFAPDAKTLLLNLQHPGLTLAIRGPWPTLLASVRPGPTRG